MDCSWESMCVFKFTIIINYMYKMQLDTDSRQPSFIVARRQETLTTLWLVLGFLRGRHKNGEAWQGSAEANRPCLGSSDAACHCRPPELRYLRSVTCYRWAPAIACCGSNCMQLPDWCLSQLDPSSQLSLAYHPDYIPATCVFSNPLMMHTSNGVLKSRILISITSEQL